MIAGDQLVNMEDYYQFIYSILPRTMGSRAYLRTKMYVYSLHSEMRNMKFVIDNSSQLFFNT